MLMDTGASVIKKKVFKKIFQAISEKKNKKKGLQEIFSCDLQKRKTKKVFANIPRDFWRFPTTFNRSKKNSAVHEPRTEKFSRT